MLAGDSVVWGFWVVWGGGVCVLVVARIINRVLCAFSQRGEYPLGQGDRGRASRGHLCSSSRGSPRLWEGGVATAGSVPPPPGDKRRDRPRAGTPLLPGIAVPAPAGPGGSRGGPSTKDSSGSGLGGSPHPWRPRAAPGERWRTAGQCSAPTSICRESPGLPAPPGGSPSWDGSWRGRSLGHLAVATYPESWG